MLDEGLSALLSAELCDKFTRTLSHCRKPVAVRGTPVHGGDEGQAIIGLNAKPVLPIDDEVVRGPRLVRGNDREPSSAGFVQHHRPAIVSGREHKEIGGGEVFGKLALREMTQEADTSIQ